MNEGVQYLRYCSLIVQNADGNGLARTKPYLPKNDSGNTSLRLILAGFGQVPHPMDMDILGLEMKKL